MFLLNILLVRNYIQICIWRWWTVFFFPVKPRIDRATFKSVTIKAGRTHKWSVDVSGEPPPTCSWIWRDNISLVTTEKIKIENIDYHTDFTIISAMRRDTGKYTLIAENASGKDQETVELTVLGEMIYIFLFISCKKNSCSGEEQEDCSINLRC